MSLDLGAESVTQKRSVCNYGSGRLLVRTEWCHTHRPRWIDHFL